MGNETGKRARQLFDSGWYCAESALRALAEAGGRHREDLQSLASGLCSGMARTSGLCGAVNGSIMGIGLYAGRTQPSPAQEMDVPYALTQEFLERFLERWGSTNCRELTGCDFATPEGQRRFREEGLGKRCRDITDFAVSLAAELLRREGFDLEDFSRREHIKRHIAPCGLNCGKCLAFEGGDIQRLSRELTDRLGPNFQAYADRLSAMNPALGNYGSFRDLLEYLGSGECGGCRGQGCLFQACKVPACAGEHGVDFCFECKHFPCERHGMPPGLAERWRQNNESMRDTGLEAFYELSRQSPRYP